MQAFHFNRESLSQIDEQHLNLAYNQDAYLPYINRSFSINVVENQIDDKKIFPKHTRNILVQSLTAQYENVTTSDKVKSNIELLKSKNTFTITTGHQLSLFTGPLFFVIKIMHAIKLCERLSTEYPDYNFVPVYWMASEDHDFEEIQSFSLFKKEIKWETDQSGPVGRFDTDGLGGLMEMVKAFFDNHPESEIHELLKAYEGENFSIATRQLVNKLFSDYGLVILDADNRELKSQFSSVIKHELTDGFSNKAVSKTNAELQKDGVKIQVNPREINLFYIKKGLRKRIIKIGDKYHVDEVGNFTKSELEEELKEYPERFSPNVILRPVYQETILPNLVYIGGAGELSYWLQLKGVFDAAGVVYPLISLRNSVLWIDELTSKKISKLDLVMEDLFRPIDKLKKEYIETLNEEELNFDQLDEQTMALSAIMRDSILATDDSMEGYSSSEVVKLNKQMDNLKSKLIRIAKSKNESSMKAIDQIMEKLFPGGKLQERTINFFQLCPNGDYKFKLDILKDCIDPEINDLIVIRE